MKVTKISKNIYIKWTLIFVLTAIAFFSPFVLNKKAIIFGNGGDGIAQHYTALAYYGRYLRQVFSNIFIDHSFEIPMWDSSIGYGSDIITTLSYYVMGDPFSFLAVLCPEKYTEYLYELLIVLRIYFAGVSFIYYCRENEKSDYASLLGAVVYAFSAYTVYAPVLHPYFATPMVWYPLILTGIDRIFKGKKPTMYITSVAMAALSNFYFFYMFVILIIMYALFRYFGTVLKKSVSGFFIIVGKFFGYSLVACGCAAVLLIPTVYSMMDSSRIDSQHFQPLFYPIQYYKEFLGTFVTSTLNGYYSYMGYSVLALICIFYLFLNKGRGRDWKLYFVLLTIMLLIPYAGIAFNGMTYVTNRWIWAYAFCVAYICTDQLPEVTEGSDRKRFILCSSLMILYFILMYAMNRGGMNIKHITAVAIAVIMIPVLLTCRKYQVMGRVILMVLVAANVSLNAWYAYDPKYDNYLSNFQDAGTAYEADVTNTPGYALREETGVSKSERFDTMDLGADRLLLNSSLLTETSGTSFYYSSSNNGMISELQKDMYLKYQFAHQYLNLDERRFLQRIMGVRYLVAPMGSAALPGFSLIASSGAYDIFEDNEYIGKVQFFKNVISEKEYKQYDVVRKQQALLQGAVVENENDLEICNPEFLEEEVPYEMTLSDGISFDGKQIEVLQNDATITLSFNGIKGAETYLVFDEIDYEDFNYWYVPDSSSVLSRIKAYIWNHQNNGRVRAPIIASGNVSADDFNVSSVRENYYTGRHEFLLNLGYSDDAQDTITVIFPYTGKYKVSGMRVICQPLAKLDDYSKELRLPECDINDNGNEQNIRIVSDSKGILSYSLPFSKGWSVTVDGEKGDVIRVGTMSLGVQIPNAGKHDIVFRYETPFLKFGALVSLISVICAVLIARKSIVRKNS